MEASMDTVEETIGNQFRAFHKRLELRDVTLEKLDSRIGSFEEHLAQKFAYQDEVYDRKFTKFEELLQSFTNQASPDNTRAFRRSSSASLSRSTRRTQGVPRLATIDFPRFNGDKLKEWLFQVEQFFEIEHTPDDVKVNLASRHMEDVAANWHQSLENSEYGYLVLKDWRTYKDVLVERFEHLWEYPVAEQKNLREIDEQYDVFDTMIQSVQSWREEMKEMFKSWREEDLTEKKKRKDELSPIEKYFATKHSIPKESSSDMPQTYIVLDDNSSLDSRTEVITHQTTTNSTLDSSTDALVKEPSLLVKSVLTTSSIMVKDSMVFQVSISKLEPCLEIHTVSVGVGGVRQGELGLDDSFDRCFESSQVPSVEVWPEFFQEPTDIMVIHIKPLEVSKSWHFKYKGQEVSVYMWNLVNIRSRNGIGVMSVIDSCMSEVQSNLGHEVLLPAAAISTSTMFIGSRRKGKETYWWLLYDKGRDFDIIFLIQYMWGLRQQRPNIWEACTTLSKEMKLQSKLERVTDLDTALQDRDALVMHTVDLHKWRFELLKPVADFAVCVNSAMLDILCIFRPEAIHYDGSLHVRQETDCEWYSWYNGLETSFTEETTRQFKCAECKSQSSINVWGACAVSGKTAYCCSVFALQLGRRSLTFNLLSLAIILLNSRSLFIISTSVVFITNHMILWYTKNQFGVAVYSVIDDDKGTEAM